MSLKVMDGEEVKFRCEVSQHVCSLENMDQLKEILSFASHSRQEKVVNITGHIKLQKC